MINPIKTPTQMMYEQANLPHYGKGGDVIGQFANRIQDAIRKYTKAVGHPPSAEEVKQLEDHIRSLSAPSPKPAETMARMQQQTPFANQLVDASGRPYPTATSPTGQMITPERAKGVTTRESIGPFQGVPSQFDMTPVNMKARAYPKGQFQNAFPEDEFMSMANTGRTGNRTWNKSFTPSTEELAARQHTTEEALTGLGDEAGGGLGAIRATEGDIPQMTSASAPFAERAASLEAPGLDKLTDEMLLGKHGALVDKVVADFKSRGIEPDKEDVVNAINAMINPMRHNYTGTNPIGLRPPQPGGGGRPTPEMLSWRDEARMSGLPETVVTKHPSDWKPQNQRDYLLDTEPAQRAPFAQDWQLQELEDKRRRAAAAVEGKAEGGYMQSPRDMQAEMMVRGYAGGGSIGNNFFSVLENRDMSNPRYREYLANQQNLEGVYPETFVAPIARGLGSLAKTARGVFASPKPASVPYTNYGPGAVLKTPIGAPVPEFTPADIERFLKTSRAPQTVAQRAGQSTQEMQEGMLGSIVQNYIPNGYNMTNEIAQIKRLQNQNKQQPDMSGVPNYDQGGLTRPLFGQGQPMSQREIGAEIMRNPPQYPDPFDRVVDSVYRKYYSDLDKKETSEMRPYTPGPRERLAELGTSFLKKHMTAPTARRVAANTFGGENSDLPFGFGAVDVAAMLNPTAMMATIPLQAADAGFSAGQGDYTGAILGAGLSGPATRAYGRGINRIKQSFNQ